MCVYVIYTHNGIANGDGCVCDARVHVHDGAGYDSTVWRCTGRECQREEQRKWGYNKSRNEERDDDEKEEEEEAHFVDARRSARGRILRRRD